MTTSTSSPRLLRSARSIQGSLRLPGDKSISHRYAMLAALAEGASHFTNFSDGADCASTLSCMQQLGAKVEHAADGTITITGCSGRFSQPSAPLDCGNSGSTMRMLAGLLAAQSISCNLFGDASLSRRPMLRIVDPLKEMGADITATENGRPPLQISAPKNKLQAIDYTSPVSSAQVKSAALFAGLQAVGETQYHEPTMTRDHTELALRAFGSSLMVESGTISIIGGQKLKAIDAAIPGDVSSAAFFLCAAALLPGSSLILDAIGLNPTRAAILDVLTGMGARISVIDIQEHHGEMIGALKIEHNRLRGAKIRGSQSALLIDELPVLAAIAPWTEEGVSIRDARELRVKESDRIAAVAENLKRMGAQFEVHEDGITIPGRQSLHGAELDAQGDHRIAMAFAITALKAEGKSTLHGAEHVGISFPKFWEFLDKVAS